MFAVSFLGPQLPLRCGLCKKLGAITTLQFDFTVEVGFYLFGAF